MKKLLLAAVLFTAIFTSCKKETVVNYSSNTLVTGTWGGKYSAAVPPAVSNTLVDWSVSLKADGNCRVYDGKIADTASSLKLDGVYNVNEGKLKLFARSTGSFQCKFDATLSNNSLDGAIIWSYFSGATPVTLAGSGNLAKQ
jgi:hypothetical protein